MNFSKSKYTGFWQCPKIVWLKKYKPEKYVIDEAALNRMTKGNEIGDLAMQLFGDYIDVTVYKNDDELDLSKMIELTKQYIDEGKDNICEAAFSYNGLYCAVDILLKTEKGYAIYEVKAATDWEKDIYYVDVAYQKYVLTLCGINVTDTYIININNEYVFDGTLDIHKFFQINDVGTKINIEYMQIEDNLIKAEKMLDSDIEPNIEVSQNCNCPYRCGFFKYCIGDLPTNSVFDLYDMSFKKKIEYYKQGIRSFEDLLNNACSLNSIQERQIDYALNDKGTYINKHGIYSFLSTLKYPIYFLDFETIQPIVPEFVGTRPYQQIPFQYSLHYIEKEGGELKHKEFLGISGKDFRRELAERLVKDIPDDVCILAYNKGFECSIIKQLAKIYPDLSAHLLKIHDNISDLLIPFRKGYYYNRAMRGSFSIKSVLPAIFPADPSLSYDNLDGIHNGSDAMSIFPLIKDMPANQQEETYRNLLKYCELDTYAMVKVWQELLNKK